MAKLLHVLEGADFRCRQEGLMEWARKEKKVKAKLAPGDIIAFLNAKKDRIAMIAILDEKDSFGVLGTYRSPHGRVPPEAIEFIPRAFGANGLDMNQAIRLGLEKLLAKKRARKAGSTK